MAGGIILQSSASGIGGMAFLTKHLKRSFVRSIELKMPGIVRVAAAPVWASRLPNALCECTADQFRQQTLPAVVCQSKCAFLIRPHPCSFVANCFLRFLLANCISTNLT